MCRWAYFLSCEDTGLWCNIEDLSRLLSFSYLSAWLDMSTESFVLIILYDLVLCYLKFKPVLLPLEGIIAWGGNKEPWLFKFEGKVQLVKPLNFLGIKFSDLYLISKLCIFSLYALGRLYESEEVLFSSLTFVQYKEVISRRILWGSQWNIYGIYLWKSPFQERLTRCLLYFCFKLWDYLWYFFLIWLLVVYCTGALFVVLNQAPNMKVLGLLQVMLQLILFA